jgi:hypothetical protein
MLGVADVVDTDTTVDELSWMLRRPRRLQPTSLADAGIDLSGAEQTARVLASLASAHTRTFAGVGAGR